MKRTSWIAGLFVVGCFSVGYAQFPEDALRFSTSGLGTGARALGMGNAYTGVASDFSALFWNPAGLAQIQHGEFSFGLSHLINKDNSTFFNTNEAYTNNATKLNSLGLVFPLPVRRGNAVIAFGYTRQSDFTTGVSFKGFNPNSSIIQTWAPNGQRYPEEVTLAEDLLLAGADTNTGRFISPITGRLTQLGKVTEEGGLSNWSAGGAIDIARNLSVGITLTYVSGTYQYARNYKEQDNDRIYTDTLVINGQVFDFDELIVDDDVEGDLSGVSAKFGLMFRLPERFRFGVTIKTPTSFRVKETFNTTAQSFFDNGDTFGPFDSPGSNEYDVVTPWVFSAGASFIIKDLVLSSDIEYTDWTQLRFEDANADLIAYNRKMKELFRGTANLRVGAEYDLHNVRLRGGVIYNTSPYQGDPSSFDQKYITAGLGVPLGESTMLDLAYARGWWDTFRTNYDASSRVNEKITTNNFLMTFSYRF